MFKTRKTRLRGENLKIVDDYRPIDPCGCHTVDSSVSKRERAFGHELSTVSNVQYSMSDAWRGRHFFHEYGKQFVDQVEPRRFGSLTSFVIGATRKDNTVC